MILRGAREGTRRRRSLNRAMSSLRRAFVAAALCAAAFSQDSRPADAAGRWAGAVEVPGAPLAVVVVLRKDGDAWAGTIDIPAQATKDFALAKIVVDGAKASFLMPGVPGTPRFEGEIAQDGATLAGTFKQGLGKFPFTLKRAQDPVAAARERLGDFAAWCEAERARWKAPGLAVAVVRRSGPVFASGFGTKDLDGGGPVDADTLFAIGSSTKAFTTWILATLVEEGRLAWDKPVKGYLPAFDLADRALGARVTPRDLVTHRTGLPRHDLVWYGASLSREEVVRRLPHLPLSEDLRATWQYNNLAYAAAGRLAEVVGGASWEDLVLTRIFKPLGMTRANFDVAACEADANAARPYEEREGAVTRRPYRSLAAIGPAGSINASVKDLARWAALHLAEGRLGDATLLPATAVADLHKPRMTLDGPADPDDVVLGYASGWVAHLRKGRRLIEHGGNIDGFSAQVSLYPDDDLAVVALTNLDASPLPVLATLRAAELILDPPPKDRSAEALAAVAAAKAALKEGRGRRGLARVEGTKPSRNLDAYVGRYEDAGYGVVEVARAGEGLRLDLHGLPGPLEHWHDDVFLVGRDAADPTLEDVKAQFRLGFDGEIEELRMVLEPSAGPVVFRRAPDADLVDPARLGRFVGRYSLSGRVATVARRGDGLTVTIPGQPTYELAPGTARTFRLVGLEGYRVRFGADDDGKIVDASFLQPEGVFVMKRVD